MSIVTRVGKQDKVTIVIGVTVFSVSELELIFIIELGLMTLRREQRFLISSYGLKGTVYYVVMCLLEVTKYTYT